MDDKFNNNMNHNIDNSLFIDNNNEIFKNDKIYKQDSTVNLDSNVSDNFWGNDVFLSNNLNNNISDLGDNTDINSTEIKISSKRGIKDILVDKKFLMVVSLFIFIFTCITVFKTFYLRHKVDDYEGVFIEIEQKESSEMHVSVDTLEDSESNGIAADNLVNCIKSPLDINNLPDSINLVITEINNYYNQSNNYFAFKYKDIYTGFSVSYNEKQRIFGASTVKAPKDIYIYEMASLGKIDLGEKLTYTSKYYNSGAWQLKNKKYDTKYDIKTLANYSTVDSDNAAHNMLMDRFGRENMLNFWKEKGTNAVFTQRTNWGANSANDASIYMSELYKFYLENKEYGQELMNNFLNAHPKFITGKNDYKVANKSGWAGSSIHDVSIVFAENPYIVVALSNLGATGNYMSYFNKANNLAYKLHTEYWKYKMDVCNHINQY